MEMRTLKCDLTETEVQQRADKLANTIREHTRVEQEKKDTAAQFKLKIEALDGEISELAREVSEKAAYRPVECKLERNNLHLTMELVRCDTGEVIETRPMKPEEKQASLFSIARSGASTSDEADA